MADFYDCVLLKHGLAWGVGAGIFLLTIFLVSRRIIGFFLSLILMLIALGTSMAIEHQDDAIRYWNKYVPEVLKLPESPAAPEAPKNGKNHRRVRHTPTNTPVTPPTPSEPKDENLLKGATERQKQRVDTFTPP